MLRKCRFCWKQKSVNEFYKRGAGEYRSKCKECFSQYAKEKRVMDKKTVPDFIEKERQKGKEWREKNKDKINAKSRARYATNPKYYVQKSIEWQAKNKDHMRKYGKIYTRLYRGKNPWARTLNSIRCRIRENPYYKNVKNELTLTDLKIMWFRDGAYDMKKPSIDRIDPKGNYTVANCRYLELGDNVRNGNKDKKRYITRSLNRKLNNLELKEDR